jgi:hypothetical protein
MTLAEELYSLMQAAVVQAPRPKGMDAATYARHVLDAVALKQLERAERQQEYRRMELEAKQAALENGSRYYICHPYHGIACDVFPNELERFAKWSGVKLGNLKKMLDGQAATASDWRPWSVLLKIDAYGNPLVMHQLCRPFTPSDSPVQLVPSNYVGSVPVVHVKWREMPYDDARKFSQQARQGPTQGVMAAIER